MIDSDLFFVMYLGLILAPVAALAIWSRWRDGKLRAPPKARVLFRCSECIRFYEGEAGAERLPCPVCGRQNQRLKL